MPLRTISVAIVAGLLALACATSPARDVRHIVSITQLKLQHEAFDGRDVAVSGYARVVDGLALLFLTRDHAAIADVGNAVALLATARDQSIDELQACQDRYVTVFGRWREVPKGPSGVLGIDLILAYPPSGGEATPCYDGRPKPQDL